MTKITHYKIYLLNKSTDSKQFWAFLSKPEITNTPKVFANSNTSLVIPGGSTDLNLLTIPIQYVIGAGASNNAVELDILIQSNATRNTDLGESWQVKYFTIPPYEGPIISEGDKGSVVKTSTALTTTPFNAKTNAENGWYENMSFGLKTSQGFMGVTWKPEANTTYTITPKLTFYISTGSYSSNSLADITQVSETAAKCNIDQDFDEIKECTVTYTEEGEWIVKKGRPTEQMLKSVREEFMRA